MFHNTPVIDRVQKVRKIKQNSKTPGDLHGCPTRGVGRTPTMFHNTLVVGSSPTSSTMQSHSTGKFPQLWKCPLSGKARLLAGGASIAFASDPGHWRYSSCTERLRSRRQVAARRAVEKSLRGLGLPLQESGRKKV